VKQTIFLIFLVFAQANVHAQSQESGTSQFTAKQGKHTAKVIFRTGSFRPSIHKITYGKRLDATIVDVDGRMALGVDGSVPRVEIKSLDFSFDGKKVAVPKRLYADLFEPNLKKDYFATKIGDDGSSLLVFMAGSDAAGGYQVIWVFRRDGRHSRFSTPCSDCDFKGFMGFFVDQFAR
jgi:hypothetical protein